MNTERINFFSYTIPKREAAPAGQLYLGTFLAFSLFFSFFFGNLLFFLIVLIISIFIFLERETDTGNPDGTTEVNFSDTGVLYGSKEYQYKDLSSFTIYEELFGEREVHIGLSFKSPGRQEMFIPAPNDVQIQAIYDIIVKHVRENRDKTLSLTDAIVLRFF